MYLSNVRYVSTPLFFWWLPFQTNGRKKITESKDLGVSPFLVFVYYPLFVSLLSLSFPFYLSFFPSFSSSDLRSLPACTSLFFHLEYGYIFCPTPPSASLACLQRRGWSGWGGDPIVRGSYLQCQLYYFRAPQPLYSLSLASLHTSCGVPSRLVSKNLWLAFNACMQIRLTACLSILP